MNQIIVFVFFLCCWALGGMALRSVRVCASESIFVFRFLGSSWASFVYGWGNLICMYLWVASHKNLLTNQIIIIIIKILKGYVHGQHRCGSITREFFLATTVGLFIWIGCNSILISILLLNIVEYVVYPLVYSAEWWNGVCINEFKAHLNPVLLMLYCLLNFKYIIKFFWSQDLHFGRTVRHTDIHLPWDH